MSDDPVIKFVWAAGDDPVGLRSMVAHRDEMLCIVLWYMPGGRIILKAPIVDGS
jgi:hypothetical protein